MLSGECNCGEVAFEITSRVKDVYICHCSVCRRSTGSNGIAVVVVNESNFHWLRGENYIRTWSKPGQDWQNSFCQICGSTLPGNNDDSRMYVPAGLLSEGSAGLRVAHHIWVDSKADWDEICDTGKQHQQGINS